jgi:hypothetical protein
MTASAQIDALISALPDWRRETLRAVRECVLAADTDIIEEFKWMGSPVWSKDGVLCVGNAHKDKVKLTFAKGAQLPDNDRLFNAGLNGGTWRAIDWREGDNVNSRALAALIRAAVSVNASQKSAKKPKLRTAKPAATARKRAAPGKGIVRKK